MEQSILEKRTLALIFSNNCSQRSLKRFRWISGSSEALQLSKKSLGRILIFRVYNEYLESRSVMKRILGNPFLRVNVMSKYLYKNPQLIPRFILRDRIFRYACGSTRIARNVGNKSKIADLTEQTVGHFVKTTTALKLQHIKDLVSDKQR